MTKRLLPILWGINNNIKNVPLFILHFVCVNMHFIFPILRDLGYKHCRRMSSKANSFQQIVGKTVYLVALLCMHLFPFWYFCLSFELVELFNPLYPIPHASGGNDDPTLGQRCCWKKNWTKYNYYYYLVGCICNCSLVKTSFEELPHNHSDQCPAWVAARAQDCCPSLGLTAAWAGAQAQGSAGQRHDGHGQTFQQLEYQHCSPSWCQAATVNDN